MAFTYKNIASIWNSAIKTNEFGENATPLAEDLSNIVDAGTSASNSIGLKNHYRNIIVGIHNWVLERMLEENKFDILRTAEEFGGGLQRIMASGLYTPQESHLLNLTANTSYHDGKYYGLNADGKVYLQTETYKVVHSRAEDFEGTQFTSPEELATWFGLIATTEKNTIISVKNSLEKRLLVSAIADCESATTPRVVKLITGFNAMCGKTGSSAYTLTALKADRELWSYFSSYCKEVIARLIDYVAEPNKKYNDGTVLTWTPSTKVETILLSQFNTDIQYLGNPIEMNPVTTKLFKTVPWWQSQGTTLLPDYADTAKIVVGASASPTTYTNVVGFIYDKDGIGCEVVCDKVTVEPVQEEGFNNYHHHQAMRYYKDSRLASVVLELS